MLKAAIAIVIEWLLDPFREEPLDVPIGLEDIHELAGGRGYIPIYGTVDDPEPPR
jgi:hypothetical protein